MALSSPSGKAPDTTIANLLKLLPRLLPSGVEPVFQTGLRFRFGSQPSSRRLQVEAHVHALQELVREQLRARAAQDAASGLKDVPAGGGDERLVDSLLGEEARHAARREAPKRL